MKYLLLVAVLAPLNSHGGKITERTVNFCIDDAFETYPEPNPGWSTFAYCRNENQLVMVLETKVNGKTVYKERKLENQNYDRSETGLPCNISISGCDVERY